MSLIFPCLIIGGGIAGVTCAETLHHLDEKINIGLITGADTIKSITNLHKITKLIEDFVVIETPVDKIMQVIPQLSIIKGIVDYIDILEKCVSLMDGRKIHYKKLCICSGGQPKLIAQNNNFVVGIRDTQSVEFFSSRLNDCKKIAIVGNGGIATELVHEISDCEILWLVKDKTISSHYFDSAAAQFLLDSIGHNAIDNNRTNKIDSQRHHFSVDGRTYMTEKWSIDDFSGKFGGALGPDWAQNLHMRGASGKKVEIKYEVEITKLETEYSMVTSLWQKYNGKESICPHKVALFLSDETVEFCDLVVSATGVVPAFPAIVGGKISISESDGGILVDESMATNIEDVYAAGDCCTANWTLATHWFQMRLWNQARTMAFQAAKGMLASLHSEPSPMLDFGFELFTHVTEFFGFSVILLGLYNGQGLSLEGNDRAELLIRTSPGMEYIKCVVVDGRVQGAILIGNTELAETLEDLILDQIDVSIHGEHLLDPDVDIVDYFD